MSRPRDRRPDPATYRPPAGLTAHQRTAEQDAAAGDRRSRLVTRPDGSAVLGSIALRCYPKSRRVYAYLRWASAGSGTAERYLGDVSDFPDRPTALRDAGRRASQYTASTLPGLHAVERAT